MKTPDQGSVTIGTQSLDAMWASVIARATVQKQPDGSMTVQQFAKQANMTTQAASNFLDAEVSAGRMTVQKMKLEGGTSNHAVRVYTPSVPSSRKSITKRL